MKIPWEPVGLAYSRLRWSHRIRVAIPVFPSLERIQAALPNRQEGAPVQVGRISLRQGIKEFVKKMLLMGKLLGYCRG